MAYILKYMADLLSKQEKTRDILNKRKSRKKCDRTKFRGIFTWMNNFPMIFSSSVCFLFAITNETVKVLMKGCFGSDLINLTNISNSFSCFLGTWREKSISSKQNCCAPPQPSTQHLSSYRKKKRRARPIGRLGTPRRLTRRFFRQHR